jgi:hypothetical protein
MRNKSHCRKKRKKKIKCRTFNELCFASPAHSPFIYSRRHLVMQLNTLEKKDRTNASLECRAQ